MQIGNKRKEIVWVIFGNFGITFKEAISKYKIEQTIYSIKSLFVKTEY